MISQDVLMELKKINYVTPITPAAQSISCNESDTHEFYE